MSEERQLWRPEWRRPTAKPSTHRRDREKPDMEFGISPTEDDQVKWFADVSSWTLQSRNGDYMSDFSEMIESHFYLIINCNST